MKISSLKVFILSLGKAKNISAVHIWPGQVGVETVRRTDGRRGIRLPQPFRSTWLGFVRASVTDINSLTMFETFHVILSNKPT